MNKKKKGKFEKKLKAYSAVAASTLLLAPSANAAIQYSGLQNLTVSPGNDVMVDMDGDTNTDVRFWVNTSYYPTYNNVWIDLDIGYSATSFIAESALHSDPANLPSNYLIQSTLSAPNYWTNTTNPFSTLAGTCTTYCRSYGSSTWGNFNPAIGYIGVRFPAACGSALGWIRFQGISPTQGTVIDWAYEDTCAPILAGDRGAPLIPVPTLNQWGLFALVALLAGAGVIGLRKQEEV